MAISRPADDAGAGASQPPVELEAAKKKIAELEAALEASKKEASKLTDSLVALDAKHSALLQQHEKLREENADLAAKAVVPEKQAAPKAKVSDAETEEEIAHFNRVKDSKFADGFVYCEARATVFGHGEVKYEGQRFWQKKDFAKEQAERGQLEILAAK